MNDKHDIITAMMLLEYGTEGLNPEYGDINELAMAAHSYLSKWHCGRHSYDRAIEIVAKIEMAAAIDNAKWHESKYLRGTE